MSLLKEHWPKVLDFGWKLAVILGLFLNAYLKLNFVTHTEYADRNREFTASINTITIAINQMTTRLEVMRLNDDRLADHENRLRAIEKSRALRNPNP